MRTDLTEANLTQARLQPVELKRQDGQSTGRFWSATLAGANLRRARMIKTILTSANLSGTDLTEADFSGAVLRGANLADARLGETEFHSADLADAKLPPDLRR
jgi:uncharacterized protein YjbI with pentapeptide repeats